LGYGVFEAADEDEAFRIWERQQAKIELLLTDMVMPGSVTGLELARRLKQQKPELKVILSSGYSGELLESNSADWQQFAFLPKPYPTVLLAKVVRQTLDGEKADLKPTPTEP
jgi:CheY-like chemotaxis protein